MMPMNTPFVVVANSGSGPMAATMPAGQPQTVRLASSAPQQLPQWPGLAQVLPVGQGGQATWQPLGGVCVEARPQVLSAPLPVTLASLALGCADAPKLTRGARRRQQQRLRKKLGKLERMRAACGLPPTGLIEPLPAPKRCPAAGSTVAPAALTVAAASEPPEVPVLVSHEAARRNTLDLPIPHLSMPAPVGVSAHRSVPVCAIQKDTKLKETTGVDTRDVLVGLPLWGKKFVQLPPATESVDTEDSPKPRSDDAEVRPRKQQVARGDSRRTRSSWAKDARTRLRSRARKATWPGPGAQIPTSNTFVHFTTSEPEQPRRRSLSI